MAGRPKRRAQRQAAKAAQEPTHAQESAREDRVAKCQEMLLGHVEAVLKQPEVSPSALWYITKIVEDLKRAGLGHDTPLEVLFEVVTARTTGDDPDGGDDSHVE